MDHQSQPVSLILGKKARVLDGCSVVWPRRLLAERLHDVEHQLHGQVPVGVDMDLEPLIPVFPHRGLCDLGCSEPLALVTIKIPILHLHQLREEGPVPDNLDMVGKHLYLGVTERLGLPPDLFDGLPVAALHLEVKPESKLVCQTVAGPEKEP